MKYTTKSGLELPPEVVEVIEREQARQGCINKQDEWGIRWQDLIKSSKNIHGAFFEIWHNNDFTEFYKLYPKKDLDSYGNEIVKGEMVEVRDSENDDFVNRELICIEQKNKKKYVAHHEDYNGVHGWKFCRKIQKISATELKKSELQSQMNDLLKQAKEIKAKINEL